MNGPGKTANCNVVGKAGYEGWIGVLACKWIGSILAFLYFSIAKIFAKAVLKFSFS